MARVLEVGFSFLTLLSTCWGQLGGAQDLNYDYANTVSFRYEEDSSPDIELSNGTRIDHCRSQRMYPCFTYDSNARIVDIFIDRCEDLMQLKIFGTPVNVSREQICCGYSLAGNFTNNVSCPGESNSTKSNSNEYLFTGLIIAVVVLSLLVFVLAILLVVLLVIAIARPNVIPHWWNRCTRRRTKSGTVNAECGTYQQMRRRICCTTLTELINEVCICTTPTKSWQCLCEKSCLLSKPNLLNYDSKSYVVFVIENEAERSNCIDPHLEKYKWNFHVANVFIVYMDDVETATSAKYLRVWYKESCKWNHSLLKDKVFLLKPVLQQSPSGNSRSGVMDKDGAIQKLTKVPEEQDKISTDPPVQNMLSRQQTARFSDYHVSEENVQKTVDAVTGEDPDKTATILGNTLIRRNPSSRSMARSDGGEFRENTTSQDDTPKFFTGERAEFKEIDNEDAEF